MMQAIFKKKHLLVWLLLLTASFTHVFGENKKVHNIGLLIVATGKYIQFVAPLIESANKYFCTNHKVTYFVFTDGQAPQAENIVSIYQKRLGWPYDTLMRFAMYAHAKNLYQNMDYLFACDADMLFENYVGDEILGARVGTLHPGYVGNKGTPEHNKKSTAYIEPGKNKCYFAGGFNGGSQEEFVKMAETIAQNIEIDLSKGIVAIWHDESQLQKYFLHHEPTVILSPSYCFFDGYNLKNPKLRALDKNHANLRK